MKIQNRNRIISSIVTIVFFIFVTVPFTNSAIAALIPSLSISAITGGTTAQVTVIGADPNVSVLLSYPGASSMQSVNIGTTNSSGYLSTVINAATYNIASGATVYVVVDSQASPTQTWPSYTANSGSTLPLSETSEILSVGQSAIITVSLSATLTMTSDTNPSVASASINGNQITVTGWSIGTTNITICANGIGCSTILVTVQSSSTATPTVSLAQSTINISVGQSQTVGISGSGSYYVSSNANPAIASTNINGAILTVAGVNAGSDNISICSSNSGNVSCTSLTVNITPLTNVTNSTTTNLTFGQSDVTLSVGQSQNVAVSGGTGVYYVSNNSVPSSVTANVNGSNVVVTGVAFGGDNITVCSINNECGNLYVYIESSGTTGSSATTLTTTSGTLIAPSISSFSVSSNDGDGNFIGSGNTLTITFSANQNISIPKVTVGGTAVTASGSGNGPYTATYTMTGSETLPLSIAIDLSNPAGSAGESDFWVGNNALAPSISGTVSTGAIVSSQTNNGNVSTTGYTFTQYLYDGSTGPQVTALQERLTTDGIYSGPITGTFGPLTKAAVKAYQKKHNLDQLGVVGPATRALLNQGI